MKLSNPVSSYLRSGREKAHEADRLNQRTQKNLGMAKQFSALETDRYLTKTTSPTQTAMLDENEQRAAAAADAYAEKSGIDEEQRKRIATEYKLDRKLQEHAMNENTWQKAIQSLGYTTKESAQLLANWKQQELEQQQAYQNMMFQIGSIAAMFAMA